jgi:hypothetical protein
MITLFSTPKPFEGHIGTIQRNALMSWRLLHPEIEIILFGDERGTAEICHELELRHEPKVERSAEGTKHIRSIFEPVQQMARYDVLCYSNCDIILGQDFLSAIQRACAWTKRFLMVGRRWDADVTTQIGFSDANWEEKLRQFFVQEGVQRLYYNIDYFVFPRGLFVDIPPLAIGRVWWDHWLIWKAWEQKAAVLDASDVVLAMHQSHDYAYHPEGWKGVWYGEGAQRNFKLAGGYGHLHTLEDATHRLTEQSIEPRRLFWLAPARRFVRRIVNRFRDYLRVHLWHPVLEATRPVRHAIGLRQENLRFSWRKPLRRHEFDR